MYKGVYCESQDNPCGLVFELGGGWVLGLVLSDLWSEWSLSSFCPTGELGGELKGLLSPCIFVSFLLGEGTEIEEEHRGLMDSLVKKRFCFASPK